MSKVFNAEYDATENVFRLEEKPDGVSDHQRVGLTVVTPQPDDTRSILDFHGIMSGENGEDFAAQIEEMFPIEK